MKQPKKQLWSKVFLIFLTVMIVLGFTIPTFFNTAPPPVAEPRICQADSDCYLMCGANKDEPVTVLCSENLCQQNSCEEFSLFPYKNEAVKFKLQIESLNLEQLSSPKNIFVKFNDNQAEIFTSGLSLDRVLEKINHNFAAEQMQMTINGDDSVYYGGYVPQEGDAVIISLNVSSNVNSSNNPNSSLVVNSS